MLICFCTGILLFCTDFAYSFPVNITQHNDKDTAFSSDGPIVVYEDGKIFSCGVKPQGKTFKTFKYEVSKKDLFACFVDEIEQMFWFRLKDTIIAEKPAYGMPDKMLMVSDIEGNFKGLKMILMGAGVVDKDLNWTFGNGHLVLVGDLFDRWINVTECLWLMYKLEGEAERQGGKVHMILGNHEFMNLKGDYRYVKQKSFINADSLKLDYAKWYAQNTELGRWLRSKNTVEKIGGMLFVHGGISSNFPCTQYSLERLNEESRLRIDMEMTKEEKRSDLFVGRDSPIWFRGIADGKSEGSDVERILATYGAEKMIIGHTIFDSLTYLYDKNVVAIDLEHQLNTEKGFMNGLYFENGVFYVLDDKGGKKQLQ